VQHKVKHEDRNDDAGPLMNIENSINKEVDYKFHSNVSFVQIELGLEEEDIDDNAKSINLRVKPTLQALIFPNMWIGNTSATKHSTKHKQGGINSQLFTSRTRGIYGQAVKPAMEVDLHGMYCDKNGKDQLQ
jgi:hypothetical protein